MWATSELLWNQLKEIQHHVIEQVNQQCLDFQPLSPHLLHSHNGLALELQVGIHNFQFLGRFFGVSQLLTRPYSFPLKVNLHNHIMIIALDLSRILYRNQ